MTTKSTGDALQHSSPIVLSELMLRLNNNVKIATLLLQEFHKSLPNYFAQFPDSFVPSQLACVSDCAHKLKGTALTLAAKSMADAAKELEIAAKAGNFAQAKLRYPNVKREIQRFLDWSNSLSGKLEEHLSRFAVAAKETKKN